MDGLLLLILIVAGLIVAGEVLGRALTLLVLLADIAWRALCLAIRLLAWAAVSLRRATRRAAV